MLSTRAKESIKTALAMTIAYGIALHMDWDNAYWAAFAVAFCSLATIGQSMNKAAMRMLGTFLAIGVAFVLIALFAQQRWLFIFFLSLWLAFCAYMGSGPRRQYFWMISGLASAVVAIKAGPDAANAFAIAAVRAQETALGILVYTLVTLFIWPIGSRASFMAAATKLASAQRQLSGLCIDLLSGRSEGHDGQSVASDEATARSSMNMLIAAAETDDVEIRMQRKHWGSFQRMTSEMGEALGHWRESLAEYKGIDLRSLIPGLTDLGAELDARFEQVEAMLAGNAPDRELASVSLAINPDAFGALSNFQKAAVAVIHERLEIVDRCTKQLVDCVGAIKGFGETTIPIENRPTRGRVFAPPDWDRLVNATRLFLVVFMAWLAVIYIEGVPGGTSMIVMCAAIGMNLVVKPQLKVRMLYRSVAYGILLASLLYIFVMPHLSSFVSLGPLIFGVTFFLSYRFSEPHQALDRAMGLAMFVLVAAIDNEQTYSFLSVATSALIFPPFFLIMAVTEHIPVSLKPEKAFRRLSGRFFRSSEKLLNGMMQHRNVPPTKLDNLRWAFHLHEVATLPEKLAVWGQFIGPGRLPGTSPAQIQALVASLQQLGRRLRNLVELPHQPRSEILAETLGAEIRSWRLAVGELLLRLSGDPNAAADGNLQARLSCTVERLEECIAETLDRAPDGQLTTEESRDFYLLLGAYRAVSEALVGFSDRARGIEWTPWFEERFA